jgi:hypothetical protein
MILFLAGLVFGAGFVFLFALAIAASGGPKNRPLF